MAPVTFRIEAVIQDLPKEGSRCKQGYAQNVHCFADDALICGSGETTEEATRDHDRVMQEFLVRSAEKAVSLNPDKLIYKVTQMIFIGHLLTSQGILPDLDKRKAVTKMPNPTDVTAAPHAQHVAV